MFNKFTDDTRDVEYLQVAVTKSFLLLLFVSMLEIEGSFKNSLNCHRN